MPSSLRSPTGPLYLPRTGSPIRRAPPLWPLRKWLIANAPDEVIVRIDAGNKILGPDATNGPARKLAKQKAEALGRTESQQLFGVLGSVSTSDASGSRTDQSLLSLTDQAVAGCWPRKYASKHPRLE